MSTEESAAPDKSLKRKHEDDAPEIQELSKRQKRRQAKKEKRLRAEQGVYDTPAKDVSDHPVAALAPPSLKKSSPVEDTTSNSTKHSRKKSKHRKSLDTQDVSKSASAVQTSVEDSAEQSSTRRGTNDHQDAKLVTSTIQLTGREKRRKLHHHELKTQRKQAKHDNRVEEKQKTQSLKENAAVKASDSVVTPLPQNWTLANTQAGLYAKRDPIFLGDMLVTAVGQEIRGLHVQTSLVARTLPERKNATIVSFDAVQTSNEAMVRVLYNDGTLVDWDWTSNSSDESRPKAKNIDVYRLAVAVGERIASVCTTWVHGNCAILVDGIKSYQTKERIVDLKILHDASTIIARSLNTIIVGRKDTTDEFTWFEMPWSQGITCFDAREVDNGKQKDFSLVVGQQEGQLQLYNNVSSLFSSGKLPTPLTLHWHRHAVRSAKFSPDGTYIISGGQETVLVIWQLATGQKQFLPNLTATIDRIVINDTGNRYALCMGDNSIMVLSTSELKPVANFAGLQVSLEGPVAAVLDPRTAGDRLLVVVPASQDQLLESRPFLQTYDLAADKHISRQALTRNNVTDFNTTPDGIPVKSPDVQHIQLSRLGQWMATIDTWTPPHRDFPHLESNDEVSPEVARKEVYLKFWQWDEKTKLWLLNSRVDQPHGSGISPGTVYKMVSDPAKNGFITVGDDSVVKIWRPQKKVRQGVVVSSDDQEEVEWKCRLSIELDKYQDRSDLELDQYVTGGAALTIADDGSLLAATIMRNSIRQVIHFIDTETGDIKASKDNIAAADLVDIAFLDHYLAIMSTRSLRLWDTVRNTMFLKKKFEPCDAPMLAVSKVDNAIAVATPSHDGTGRLYIWRPEVSEGASKIKTRAPITALLNHPQARGLKVILEDGTIQTLSSTSGLSRAQQLVLSAQQTAGADAEEIVSSFEEATQQPTRFFDEGTMMLAAEASVEDDRTVVRPEELAKVFDVGSNSSALPSVRDMFHAVANLFGRKPVAV